MKKLLSLVPVILFVLSCGGGGKSIYPLTVGNEWHYLTITATTLFDSTTTDTTTVDVEVTAETNLDNGKTVFEVVTGTSTSYVEDADDYVFGYDEKSDTIPDTLLALPLEEGKSWTVHSDSSGTYKTYVVGKENVTVPAGTYNDCWKLGSIVDNDTTGINTYYAEGTGMVKMRSLFVMDTTMSTETTQQLDSVTIK